MQNIFKLYAVIAVIVVAGVWWFFRQGNAAKVTGAVSQATVEAVGGVATGIVQGVGTTVGIPLTDEQKCANAMANRDSLDVSLYCPLSTWLAYEKDAMFGSDVVQSGQVSGTSNPSVQ